MCDSPVLEMEGIETLSLMMIALSNLEGAAMMTTVYWIVVLYLSLALRSHSS